MRRWLLELPVALLLKRLLGPSRRRRRAAATRPARAPAVPRPVPRRTGGAYLALVALATGALLLVVFDQWFTRLLGVLALLAFIVAGVFAIASPAFLESDPDEAP